MKTVYQEGQLLLESSGDMSPLSMTLAFFALVCVLGSLVLLTYYAITHTITLPGLVLLGATVLCVVLFVRVEYQHRQDLDNQSRLWVESIEAELLNTYEIDTMDVQPAGNHTWEGIPYLEGLESMMNCAPEDTCLRAVFTMNDKDTEHTHAVIFSQDRRAVLMRQDSDSPVPPTRVRIHERTGEEIPVPVAPGE